MIRKEGYMIICKHCGARFFSTVWEDKIADGVCPECHELAQ